MPSDIAAPSLADAPPVSLSMAPPAAAPGSGRLIGPLAGVHYRDVLRDVHREWAVERYLEIGTRDGSSLTTVSGNAICIDPAFRFRGLSWEGEREVHLYQTTSDAFFARRDPKAILGGPLQLAFVDGLHHYDFVLRDVMNCEAHCSPDGLIVLHDVLPWTFDMARRLKTLPEGGYEPVRGAWTGDVWKVLPILAKWRPDLTITLLDCPPTGLAVISNLDPESRVLRAHLDRILRERDAKPDTEAELAAWLGQLRLVDTRRAQGALRAALAG